MIDTILTNLKALVGTELGETYSELAQVIDLSKNSFKKTSKRYGVRALDSVEGPGVNRYHTHDHTFEVTLTDYYRDSLVTDEDQRAKAVGLQVKHLSLYTAAINQKAGSPASVMLVGNLSVSEPEYIENENVVAVRATFTIRYRQSLT